MKCSTFQTFLLAIENPDRPPAEVQAHLAGCAACQEWQHQLLHVERHVRDLPVPRSAARGDLVRKVLAEPALPIPGRRGSKDRGLRKLSVAVSLAAALLLLALGLWVWRHEPGRRPTAGQGPYALVGDLMKPTLSMAVGATPINRIEALAQVAGGLHGETRLLARANAPEELRVLARLYDRVLREITGRHLNELPAAEHERVLPPIAGRLSWAELEAERLAKEVPEASAGPLRDIAASARDADLGLCARLRRERSTPLPPDPETAAPPAPEERVRLFRRNRTLIEQVVQGGLWLAAEKDPVRCAELCANLAEGVAAEMRDALQQKESSRAADLGQHIGALLKQGVAANVSNMRSQIEQAPDGSSLRKKLDEEFQGVHDRMARTLQRLDRDLQRAADPGDRDAEQARIAVLEGRAEVERAMKGPPPRKQKG
jgi:hypothetical protein